MHTCLTLYARLGTSDQLGMLVPGEMYTCVAQILGVEQKENFSGRGPRTFIRFRFTDGSVQMESALFGNPKMHLEIGRASCRARGERVVVIGSECKTLYR